MQFDRGVRVSAGRALYCHDYHCKTCMLSRASTAAISCSYVDTHTYDYGTKQDKKKKKQTVLGKAFIEIERDKL